MFKFIVGFTLAVCLTLGARAQSYNSDRAYEISLLQLAETLGRAHSLRVLCNGRDDQYWRRYMVELLELEAPYSSSDRSQLIYTFNNAYSAERRRRQFCNQATVDAEAQYAKRGRMLAESLAARYLPTRRRVVDIIDE